MQTYQTGSQKIGGLAAFINALLGLGALVVAFGLIGPAALTDPSELAELAIHNPMPLIIQDSLKLGSAAAAIVLIMALFKHLRGNSPTRIKTATALGFFSVLLLLTNAGLSLFTVSQAAYFAQSQPGIATELNGLIGLLGLAVIAVNGLWYLIVSWTALKMERLPKWLCYLGLVIGGLSLLPPLGVVVLLLSVVWSLGLGLALWQSAYISE